MRHTPHVDFGDGRLLLQNGRLFYSAADRPPEEVRKVQLRFGMGRSLRYYNLDKAEGEKCYIETVAILSAAESSVGRPRIKYTLAQAIFTFWNTEGLTVTKEFSTGQIESVVLLTQEIYHDGTAAADPQHRADGP